MRHNVALGGLMSDKVEEEQISRDDEEITQIQVTKGTRQWLRDIGRYGETYDSIIRRILEQFEYQEEKDGRR